MSLSCGVSVDEQVTDWSHAIMVHNCCSRFSNNKAREDRPHLFRPDIVPFEDEH